DRKRVRPTWDRGRPDRILEERSGRPRSQEEHPVKRKTPENLEERAAAILREPPPRPVPIIGGSGELAPLASPASPTSQADWSRFLLLGPPVSGPASGSVAQIDLGTRQVSLDLRLVREKNLADCVEAILAHEVGHHVRYPGTLAVHARMRLLEKGLLPLKDYSLANLFTDLMINDALRPAYEEELCRVYKAFAGGYDWRADPAFIFYLAVYEERWGRTPGELMGENCEDMFAQAYPGYRAEAQVLGQNLFHLGPTSTRSSCTSSPSRRATLCRRGPRS